MYACVLLASVRYKIHTIVIIIRLYLNEIANVNHESAWKIRNSNPVTLMKNLESCDTVVLKENGEERWVRVLGCTQC